MKRWISIALLFTASCASAPPGMAPPDAIDAEVRRLMASEDVVGLALAVIEDGKVAHVAAYGVRDLARSRPLDSDTVMYAASLAKTAFAYTVLQLADEGRIDLDASIATYLPKPLPDYPGYQDLVGDERWRMITPRIVLTHSTGFNNFRRFEEDGKLRLHWRPGSRYGYSGEGFRLLQFVLEEGLGLDVGTEMQVRVFDRLGLTRTSMLWREDFAGNFAETYTEDGTLEAHDRRRRVDAAGSMDTTIADQARLWAGVMRGEGLTPESRAAMVRGQLPISTAHQFPSLQESTDPRGATIALAAGLGVVTFKDASGPIWFKGGHDDGTGNILVCQEAHRRCVVFLSNSVRAERIYPALTRIILGDTAMPWWWEYR
jgi:CubicO group peptidase (beta-lactamase class C family)